MAELCHDTMRSSRAPSVGGALGTGDHLCQNVIDILYTGKKFQLQTNCCELEYIQSSELYSGKELNPDCGTGTCSGSHSLPGTGETDLVQLLFVVRLSLCLFLSLSLCVSLSHTHTYPYSPVSTEAVAILTTLNVADRLGAHSKSCTEPSFQVLHSRTLRGWKDSETFWSPVPLLSSSFCCF